METIRKQAKREVVTAAKSKSICSKPDNGSRMLGPDGELDGMFAFGGIVLIDLGL